MKSGEGQLIEIGLARCIGIVTQSLLKRLDAFGGLTGKGIGNPKLGECTAETRLEFDGFACVVDGCVDVAVRLR